MYVWEVVKTTIYSRSVNYSHMSTKLISVNYSYIGSCNSRERIKYFDLGCVWIEIIYSKIGMFLDVTVIFQLHKRYKQLQLHI